MKKIGIGFIAMCAAAMIMLASCFTTQKASELKLDYLEAEIPYGKSLLAGVYNFVTEKSDTWAIYDARFISIDPISEKYTFSGSFIVKLSDSSFLRYDFASCTVQKNENTFDVTFGQMGRYPCSEDGKRITYKSDLASSLNQTAKLFDSITGADKISAPEIDGYAKQIKNEILMRMSNWSDSEYETALNKAVTSPIILGAVAQNSDLVFTKFISDNEVIGRTASYEVITTNVTSNSTKEYKYYISGKIFAGSSYDQLKNLSLPSYVSVSIYTNNDSVIRLKPQDMFAANLLNPPKDSVYTTNGTIKDIKRSVIGGIDTIRIYE